VIRLAQVRLIVLVSVLAISGGELRPVLAQDETAPTASASVYDALLEVYALIDDEQLDDALAYLDQIQPEHAYDQARIEQVRGFTYYSMQDHASAIAAFQTAIATGGLTESQAQDFEYSVLQVSIASEDRDAILRALQAAQTPAQPDSAFNTKLFAQAYMGLEEYETALDYARRARALHGRPDQFLDRMVRYLESLTAD
jgi:tetratricopeptide (TPR) repeat protein